MEILILIVLIVLNGLFAMSEIALVTARRARLAKLAADGDGSAAVAIKLGENPTRFLSTIQIGITSIGILNGIVGEAALAGPLSEWLATLGLDPGVSAIGATVLVVVIITYVSIVVGELVPKRLGQINPEGIARGWPDRFACWPWSRPPSCSFWPVPPPCCCACWGSARPTGRA